uniref:Uncharacterized protein n=1 Tax=Rhizophora mucronata TaxID=61149 RepID=A0A2P2QTT2_RHIMU
MAWLCGLSTSISVSCRRMSSKGIRNKSQHLENKGLSFRSHHVENANLVWRSQREQ